MVSGIPVIARDVMPVYDPVVESEMVMSIAPKPYTSEMKCTCPYGSTRFITRSNTRHRRIFHSLIHQRIQCYALVTTYERIYLRVTCCPQREGRKKNAIYKSDEFALHLD